MKDHLKPCEHESCDDAIYKDVVVIGNGPSGLVTSFLLAGNVPRLRAAPLDCDAPIDDMLQARLSCLPEGQSLLETDLGALAAGLEGRSRNPVPLLMDSLLRPGADIGAQADPLVEWTHDESKRVRHIVLGRLPPGGAWHGFGSRVRSLSPAAWLALPPHVTLPGSDGGERVPAPSYAAYCRRYVAMCKLQRYFRSGVVVTSVRPERRRGLRYRVTGYVVSTGAPVQYVCRRVVLAAGAGDRPGDRPQALPPTEQDPLDTDLTSGRGAVLVVGSGVSAADAVIASRGSGGGEGGGGDAGGRHVYHVHRRAANALAALDRGVYPDYHEVYKMMCDGPLGRHHNYTSLPDHVVLEVTDADSPTGHKRVKLYDPATASIVYKTVESIAVRTGSRPDLFFLQTNFNPNNIATKCRSCHPLTPLSPRTCFLSNPWQNLKSVLGHTVQICKSRYLAAVEVNGNDDSKCTIDACNKINDDTRLISNSCCCELLDKLSDGIGFGVDPSKPVDGRSNPIAIDATTHEVLNAPPGIYAVGPVAGDNFVRFIPGGALAAVAHIHKQMKMDDD